MCVLRSVTMLFSKAFPSFHLKGDHLFSFHKFVYYFCLNRNGGIGTEGNFSIVIMQKDFRKFNFVSCFPPEMWYIKTLTGLNSELLPCDFYNCKHISQILECKCKAFVLNSSSPGRDLCGILRF